jgi:maltokinase
VAGSFARTLPSLRAAVARLPDDGLERRRWFAGKGRSVTAVELVDAAPLADGLLAFADVAYADGGAERYLVPARLDGGTLQEPAAADPLWRALATLTAGGALETLDGRLVGRAAGDTVTDGGPGRRLTEDQSNTSIVLGERLVLKCYRRLETGVSAEPEALEALAAVGSRVAPRWQGTLVHRHGGEERTVSVLMDFVPGEPLGWEPVIERVRALLVGAGDRDGLLGDAGVLGVTAGELHRGLAAAFGTETATAADAEDAVTAARAQLRDAIASLPPDAARELAPRVPALEERLSDLTRLDGATVTRLHGDLHVAQVVRSPDGLVVVDFEGEPGRPLRERRRPGSPLRDLACLLLSLDHVGVAAARRCGFGEATERAFAWSEEARRHVLDAYAAATAGDVDLPLLAALEAEKESHELLYAARVLPEWLYAPRLTLPRMLAR